MRLLIGVSLTEATREDVLVRVSKRAHSTARVTEWLPKRPGSVRRDRTADGDPADLDGARTPDSW
jgi:hypothetical protein